MGFLSIKKLRMSTILFAVVLFSVPAFAQEPGNDHDQMNGSSAPEAYAPFSLEAGGELWYPLTNYALKNNLGGVYALHFSVQHTLYKRLYGGLEIQNNQISQVTSVSFPIATATANLFFYNLGAKVSYYSSQSNDFFFSFSLVAGESWMMYNKVQGIAAPPGGFKKQAVFLCPRICESYKVNPQLRVGAEITYSYYSYTFDPTYIGITTQYSQSQTKGPSTFFAWGFSINYFMGKPKR